MKWLRFFLFSILFSIGFYGFAQTQIPNATADFIKIDPYGNIYAVKETNLGKILTTGKTFVYLFKQNFGHNIFHRRF